MRSALQFLVKLLPQLLFNLPPELKLKALSNLGLYSLSKVVFGRCKRIRSDALHVGVHLVPRVEVSHLRKGSFYALLQQQVELLR